MSEVVVDDIVAMLPPLLQSMEALAFITRHLNPPDFDQVMESVGTPEQPLQEARSHLTEWPARFMDVRSSLETASDAVLAAFGGLREVQHGNGDLYAAYRALRHAASRSAIRATASGLLSGPNLGSSPATCTSMTRSTVSMGRRGISA